MWLALLFLLGGPSPHQHCDIIELNHYYTPKGDLQFSQIIFWDFDPYYSRQVVAWTLVDHPEKFPTKCVGGRTEVRWETFRVRAPIFLETWTNFDPELEDKKRNPAEHRRGFQRVPKVLPISD